MLCLQQGTRAEEDAVLTGAVTERVSTTLWGDGVLLDVKSGVKFCLMNNAQV